MARDVAHLVLVITLSTVWVMGFVTFAGFVRAVVG